ncbi:sensor histidine kinase [Methylobrevis pamukkalensis]|uniref:histidine kinase n=1 Tax=Methylobrevis pamukkalensis TaxID=1439726 RepID=A0A1E3GYM0_9HYPH|nr:HAMP domain-containing sensor histidine kinase [Methylobrevis pamukkalensis]ODN69179.1 Sporulation kinase D [Methylobrevis pamukkalensis]
MRRLGALPLAIRIPLLVAILMIAVGAVASERVLSRLQEVQERQLSDLTDAYLDGLASSLVDPVLREDPWEVFDILDRARGLYAAVRPLETIVLDDRGTVLAASDPRRFPIGSPAPSQPDDVAADAAHVDEEEARAYARRTLTVEGREVGSILVAIDAAPILEERRGVFYTLLASNAAVTLAAAALGSIAVRRMVRPIRMLGTHLTQALDGPVSPIPAAMIPAPGTEVGRLFRSYNALALAIGERDALLARAAEEERLASLGRLASGMAHEINNPLGGLFNALDTLRVHGDKAAIRKGSVDLLDRGLKGIRDVVRTTLATYRPDRELRPLRQADIDDLRILVRPEAGRKQLALDFSGRLDTDVPIDAFQLRQVLLNVLLNACRAAPEGGTVRMTVGAQGASFTASIEDDGPGLPEDAEQILKGGLKPTTDRSGLGLVITSRMVRDLGGSLAAGTSTLGGARITITIPMAAGDAAPEVLHVA